MKIKGFINKLLKLKLDDLFLIVLLWELLDICVLGLLSVRPSVLGIEQSFNS